MIRRLSRFVGPVALAAAIGIAGCKSENTPQGSTGATAASSGASSQDTAPAGAPTYMLITNGLSPFWDSMAKGMDEAKTQLRVHASWAGPSPSNNVEQTKLFNDAVAKNVNGIGVSAVDAKALAPTIDGAIAKGIPVICFDSDAAQSKRLAYLGTNNYQAGLAAGQEARKLFPNGGKLIAFVGTLSQENAIDRYNGFKKALEGSSIQFIAEPYLDNQDKGRAQANVEDAITRYQGQGLNGLVGLYSYDGPAIITTVKKQNLRSKMKIICFDGDPETLQGLRDGMVDVTVVQKPYEFGRLSIMLLDDIHKENGSIDKALTDLKPELDKLNMKLDTANHVIDTGVTVVTPVNAPQFLQDLQEKGIAST